MGASTWAVLSRYLFLNVIQSVPVLFTLNAADAILILGGLGFWLGLPEVAEGHDLRQALEALPTGIWWTAFPWFSDDVNGCGAVATGEGLNEFVNPACGETIGTRNLLKPTDWGRLMRVAVP